MRQRGKRTVAKFKDLSRSSDTIYCPPRKTTEENNSKYHRIMEEERLREKMKRKKQSLIGSFAF
jgi:hypothetical protein